MLHAAGDGRREAQKILGVPGVDDLGLRFERTMAKDRVVNCAPGKIGRGGRFRHSKILPLVESDDRQPFPDVTEELQRLIAADAAPARHPGQDGIDLGKAVGAAAGFSFSEAQEESMLRAWYSWSA